MANSPSGDSMLDRVVRILESFDDTQPRLTVGSLARRSGIPQATTYRLVGELVQHGLLTRDDDGRVRLGLRLLGQNRRRHQQDADGEQGAGFLQHANQIRASFAWPVGERRRAQ